MLNGTGPVASRTAIGSGMAASAADVPPTADHVVISELMTGGASASDEFIELYNPTATAVSLAGLELVYVTASGATVTNRAGWTADDPPIEPGGHLLVANEAGAFAATADAVYANGLSASGGSVALRMASAATALDAVGWGSAVSTWLEGAPAVAPGAGHSLERLPGGPEGSGQDTDQNANDFVEREVPDPQDSSSPPVTAATPMPTPSATAVATATATPVATPTQTPPQPTSTPDAVLPIADARALPDGTVVTVEGVSLTDGSFNDGGGYLADATGGIAVLVAGGTFPRGALIRVSGEVDDRYHQRTIRTGVDDLVVMGSGVEPVADPVATGGVGEANEGLPVLVEGEIVSGMTQLSGGVAFDIDDGSGPARVLVLDTAGIDTQPMLRGASLRLVGIVGQRDSSGTGSAGYRIQPRDDQDILRVVEPGASVSPTPSPSPTPEDGPLTIAEARQAVLNSQLRVRGVVTLSSAILGDGTAALQDETGAIVLRLGDEAGELALGELVVVDGVRSTKSGMETIRVSQPPVRLGLAGQPVPAASSTGGVGESLEALLVEVLGRVTAGPQRTSARNVYFDLDDGSGPVRVFVTPGAEVDTGAIALGARVKLVGVVGQETSGQQPLRGYRVWPRSSADLRVIGGAAAGSEDGPAWAASADGGPSAPEASTARPAFALPLLPVPRLAARTIAPGASVRPASRTPAGVPAGGVAEGEPRGPLPVVPLQMALVAVMVAGAAGTIAAHRPGLATRVGEAVVQLATAHGEAPEEPSDHPSPPSAMEVAAARLVPLRVLEDPPADVPGSRGARTSPRSGRILPPT